MRTLIAISLLVCFVGTAATQSANRADRAPAKSAGTPNAKKAPNDALASCLAMWERSTHMSRQEWSRACRRVADRLQNLTIK